jgi:hypothetical protein
MRIPSNFISTTEISNLEVFLMFWSHKKQIILLLAVDYNISSLYKVEKYGNPLVPVEKSTSGS